MSALAEVGPERVESVAQDWEAPDEMMLQAAAIDAKLYDDTNTLRIKLTLTVIQGSGAMEPKRIVRIDAAEALDPDVFVGRLVLERAAPGMQQEHRFTFVQDFPDQGNARVVVILGALLATENGLQSGVHVATAATVTAATTPFRPLQKA